MRWLYSRALPWGKLELQRVTSFFSVFLTHLCFFMLFDPQRKRRRRISSATAIIYLIFTARLVLFSCLSCVLCSYLADFIICMFLHTLFVQQCPKPLLAPAWTLTSVRLGLNCLAKWLNIVVEQNTYKHCCQLWYLMHFGLGATLVDINCILLSTLLL